MRNSPCILTIRALAPNPARLGRHRRFQAGVVSSDSSLVLRRFALADASRPAWLNAPLFSRYQPQPAVVRHAA